MNTEIQPENEKITTSLFAIIEAIEQELHTDERELAPSIVSHMIRTGKIKLTCETSSCHALLN